MTDREKAASRLNRRVYQRWRRRLKQDKKTPAHYARHRRYDNSERGKAAARQAYRVSRLRKKHEAWLRPTCDSESEFRFEMKKLERMIENERAAMRSFKCGPYWEPCIQRARRANAHFAELRYGIADPDRLNGMRKVHPEHIMGCWNGSCHGCMARLEIDVDNWELTTIQPFKNLHSIHQNNLQILCKQCMAQEQA